MEKTPEQRINYPEPGDWVVVEKDVMFVDARGETSTVTAGSIGLMLREEYDEVIAQHAQSVHVTIRYVCLFDGGEFKFSFGDVVGVSPLDQIVREMDRA